MCINKVRLTRVELNMRILIVNWGTALITGVVGWECLKTAVRPFVFIRFWIQGKSAHHLADLGLRQGCWGWIFLVDLVLVEPWRQERERKLMRRKKTSYYCLPFRAQSSSSIGKCFEEEMDWLARPYPTSSLLLVIHSYSQCSFNLLRLQVYPGYVSIA